MISIPEDIPFTGSIPPELGGLTKLLHLSLRIGTLSGRVPVELAGLSNIRDLYIDRNQLSGSISPMFMELDALEHFRWGRNDGLCIPETADYIAWRTANDRTFVGPYCNEADRIALEQLYEDTGGENWTNSTGWLGDSPLDEWYGVSTDSLGRVTVLDLSNNGLQGHLPKTLQDLNQLSVLRLNDNPLSGRIEFNLVELALKEFRYANTDLCTVVSTNFQQ